MGDSMVIKTDEIKAEMVNYIKTKYDNQSWPFKARDRARAPPHAPCFVEVRNKHAPKKMFTLLHAPGNRTVCKKGRIILFLFSK